ncbi:hypothetical protein F1K14_15675 [Salmonella enterica subsp. enterica]|nr:hypothetical protein [Salmonella enterica subsp. enterica serovar Ona]
MIMKEYNIFYIPFWYSQQTRFRAVTRFFSWTIIYLIPVLLSFMFLSPIVNFIYLLESFLGILLVYNLYEIGYIYNDTETIKNEVSPTLRLGYSQLQFYERNKKTIYFFRFTIAISLTIIIFFSYENSLTFLLASWFIIPTYVVYNSVRNRLNIPLHFVLVTLRYCSPVLLFSGINNVSVFFIMILLFPLINTFERCAENRFGLSFFKTFLLTNKKNGRYIYYMILLVGGIFCYYYFKTYVCFVFSCYAFYYMMFRFLYTQVNINV